MTFKTSSAVSPTGILTEEHQVILVVLNALEAMIAEADANRALDQQEAHDIVSFFRGFADQWHHAKEEARLFPMLEQRGVPCEQGPVGVMLREHEEGRVCVRAMSEAVGPAASGDSAALAGFIAAGRRFIPLLRSHIEKEDHCLFPMAEQVLTDQDRRDLISGFREAEHEQADPAAHGRYLALAERLPEQYGVSRPAVARPTHVSPKCTH